MSDNLNIDDLDLQILSRLAEDGKIAYTDIAKQLFVSSGTIHVRMKKMEQLGIVEGSSLRINYGRLGYGITAFVGIFMEKSSLMEEVVAGLSEIPEVVEANSTTGQYNLFVKVVCKDTAHLRAVLQDGIQHIPGIQRTESFISLDQGIRRGIKLI